jgi:mannose-6-phosphate isomerase-like protein (cupin superfamily)
LKAAQDWHETGPVRQPAGRRIRKVGPVVEKREQGALALLLRFARQRLHAGGGAVPNAAGWIDRLPRSLPQLRPVADGRASLPVERWWPVALRSARPGLRQALSLLGPHLAWTQNPNYRRRPPHRRFLARYGYAVLVGPNDRSAPALVPHESLALGLLLLGPGNEYPRHHHPAEEIYLPLAGTALWQRGAAPWRPVAPGTPIHHPPDLPHATRTTAAPLLALYFWRGALATHARLSGV